MLRSSLSIPLVVLGLSAAHAEPLLPPVPEPDAKPRFLLARELTREPPTLKAHSLPEPRSWRTLRLAKGAGFEMRRELEFGERDVVFGLRGPFMKRKRLGLSLEVRF